MSYDLVVEDHDIYAVIAEISNIVKNWEILMESYT